MLPDVKRLVLYGCGGHARSVGSAALCSGYKALLFVDDKARSGERIMGFPVLTALPAEAVADDAIAALGDNARRAALYHMLLAAGRHVLPTVWHPDARVAAEAVLEQAGFLGALSYIGPEARIGVNAIVNTGAIVEHECTVGPHGHVAIGARMAGRSHLGAFVLLGAGAVVLDGVRVCDHVQIGAGSVVTRDIVEPGIYVGVPARKR